jgi:hypothetical protein
MRKVRTSCGPSRPITDMNDPTDPLTPLFVHLGKRGLSTLHVVRPVHVQIEMIKRL